MLVVELVDGGAEVVVRRKAEAPLDGVVPAFFKPARSRTNNCDDEEGTAA